MDGEFLTLSEDDSETPRRTAGEVFDDAFPHALTWGMTPEQYWDGDNDLPKIYHKKYLIEQEQKNREMHRLGAYIYETISRLLPFPVGFVEGDFQRQEYLPEPLPMSPGEAEEQQKRQKIKEFENFRASMLAYAAANNEKFKNQQKGGKE